MEEPIAFRQAEPVAFIRDAAHAPRISFVFLGQTDTSAKFVRTQTLPYFANGSLLSPSHLDLTFENEPSPPQKKKLRPPVSSTTTCTTMHDMNI